MKRILMLGLFVLIALAAELMPIRNIAVVSADDKTDREYVRAKVIAVGIPGASAISPVGTFLPGGPIHDKPAFQAFTQPGRILDPARILVGSTSNFGAPLARADQLPGSFLSIDPRGNKVLVPPADFAALGGQASALNGMIQLYSANSPAFLNSIHNASAATANYTSVTNPLGLSINNAFGRLWPANAPYGLYGQGTSTIADPTGEPLAGPPNPNIGGVYAGDLTNRQPQLIPGALNTGAVGTALLGRSPDGSTKAVFVVVCADGSIVQEHTLKGLDGLAPANTVAPLLGRSWEGDDKDKDDKDKDDSKRDVTPRLGVLVNYSPTRILYVSEPFENSIAAITLSDDGVVFHVASIRRIHSRFLYQPVDLAPAEMETGNPDWSSNTTLDVGSDFYVANHGNNTIVRMRQDGTIVAVRSVRLADGRSLGDARINGITTSPDGTKLWITVTGNLPGFGKATGAVLELPAFGE
jgi:hypothetical protein